MNLLRQVRSIEPRKYNNALELFAFTRFRNHSEVLVRQDTEENLNTVRVILYLGKYSNQRFYL